MDTLDVVDMLDREEPRSIIAALGCGLEFDETTNLLALSKLRYGRVILLFDASESCRQIEEQLIAFFYRWMNGILRAGKVFTVTLDDFEKTADEELFDSAMNALTRRLVPVRIGNTLDETLELLRRC